MKTPHLSNKPEELRPAFSPFGQADPAASAALQRVRSTPSTASPFDALHLQPPRLVNNPGCQAPAGSSIVTVVPRPGSLATRIEPPCSSTIFLAMGRPSPVPPS